MLDSPGLVLPFPRLCGEQTGSVHRKTPLSGKGGIRPFASEETLAEPDNHCPQRPEFCWAAILSRGIHFSYPLPKLLTNLARDAAHPWPSFVTGFSDLGRGCL